MNSQFTFRQNINSVVLKNVFYVLKMFKTTKFRFFSTVFCLKANFKALRGY